MHDGKSEKAIDREFARFGETLIELFKYYFLV